MTLTVMNAIVAITWRSLKSPEFFRLLHAIAKIAFITVRIIVSLDYISAVHMYLLTEWEGRTGKYLARGHGVRTERSEVRAP